MKLSKKEVSSIRNMAHSNNVYNQNVKNEFDSFLAKLSSKKIEEAKNYFEYLTSNKGVKTYTVDFRANGAGYLTIYNSTAEDSVNQVTYKLQNGAFGRYEKLEDIHIEKVKPETLFHNSYQDFLKSKDEDVASEEYPMGLAGV